MTVEELMIRRIANQHLSVPADKLIVARDLNGVQAQFMSNAFHAIKIRCRELNEETFGDGLVKNWTVRSTLHVFAESDLPLFMHCGEKGEEYRKNEWLGSSFWNRREKWALSPERQKYFTDVILEALANGPRARDELKAICAERGMNEAELGSMFDPWGGALRQMCERGFINYVAQEKKALCLAPDFEPIARVTAELELARRYFTHFGPASVRDAQYYFHAARAQVLSWLDALPVVSCECGGKTYFYIENGGDSYGADGVPRCLLLAGFDQLMLGYEKKESVFLAPEHIRAVFSLAGIVAPTVMLDGKVAGKWKKAGKTIRVTPFVRLGRRDISAIEQKAGEIWGDVALAVDDNA